MKNSKVKAAHLKTAVSEPTPDAVTHQKAVACSVAKRKAFSKLTDILAGDSVHYSNQKIPNGNIMFPVEWKMRFADFYYPYAKDAHGTTKPLYIDQPSTSHDVALCQRKFDALKKAGVRYVFVAPGEGEPDVRARLDSLDAQ